MEIFTEKKFMAKTRELVSQNVAPQMFVKPLNTPLAVNK